MDQWRTRTKDWLSIERRGLDDAADAAFAQVFAALPALEPSAGFVQRAVDAAWLARGRRRRTIVVASLAASVAGAVLIGAAAYGALGAAGGWLVTTTAAVVSSAALSLLLAAPTAVEWWSAGARAGSAAAGVAAMPAGVALLVGVELVGAAALYLLQRLLREDIRVRNPGPLCV